jgi:opacity protein-like surface antigen
MLKKKITSLVGVSGLVFCGVISPSLALADSSWSGPYVGGSIGWANHKATWDDIEEDWFPGTANAESDGVIISGYGGWNWQFSTALLGIEADLSFANNSTTDSLSDSTFDDITKNEVTYLSTIRGRAGIIVDDYLVFATFGFAAANIEVDMTSVRFPTDVIAPSDYNEGWVVGAGVERKLSDNSGLKLEALFYDFGSDTYEQLDGGNPMKISNEIMTVSLGYTFRF